MDLKQEEDSHSEDDEMEFCWDLFNVDLCDIVRTDLKSLFVVQNEEEQNNKTSSICIDAKEQEITAKKKNLNENGKILISNKYGKMFILYPQHRILIAFDSILLTNYLNDYQNTNFSNNDHHLIPERGISIPKKIYRVFNKIRGKKMRLSYDEKYIALCSYHSFNVYHIAQFFNENEPKPIWGIPQKENDHILEFDWNDNALFLVIANKNKQSQKYERTLKHYSLSKESFRCKPKFVGNVPNITHGFIMEIGLLMNNIFAVCFQDGFVIFYEYSSNTYKAIHALNITKHHKEEIKSKAVPYLITWMKECNQICINYTIQNEETKDKMNKRCIPYFCIFQYGEDLKTMKCILNDHTGFSELNGKDMSLSTHEGIKVIYIPILDYLIFCCKYDYKPRIYGPTRDIIESNQLLTVRYDEYRDIGNICDIGLDLVNVIPCMDLQTGILDLPPVPILILLTNKLNFGCFNIIPIDPNYNDKQILPMMRKPIRSLPPIPIIKPPAMKQEILNKYRILYTRYFKNIYKKYAPEKINKIDALIQKYSNSLRQLMALYDKLIKKYHVEPNDIEPMISEQQIEAMEYNYLFVKVPKKYICIQCKVVGDHWIMQCNVSNSIRREHVTTNISISQQETQNPGWSIDNNEQQSRDIPSWVIRLQTNDNVANNDTFSVPFAELASGGGFASLLN